MKTGIFKIPLSTAYLTLAHCVMGAYNGLQVL